QMKWMVPALQHSPNNGDDLYVVKFAPDYTPLWSVAFGGTSTDPALGTNDYAVDNRWIRPHSMALSADGIWITGSMLGQAKFGGATLTSKSDMNNYSSDIFLLKLDLTGTPLLAKSFGNLGPDVGNSIAVDSKGNPVMGGALAGAGVDFGGAVGAN